jgi:hypothetical protein
MTSAAATTTETLNGFRYAELARGESLCSPDVCGCCGREGLKKTIKLVAPDGVAVWFGVGCAAKALGVGIKVTRQARAEQIEAAEAAERAERKAISDAAAAAWFAFLTRAAGPGEVWEQIQRLGGIAAARALQKAEQD